MSKILLGEKLAVLVANGFCEVDLTEAQRALQKLGADVRIIGLDNKLVNSWNGEGWGLHYAADHALNNALAADFSMLLIPGGQRSIEKLKLTAHTKRFINGFLNAKKPLIAFDEAVELLAMTEQLAGRTVTGPEKVKADVAAIGAQWLDKPYAIDGMLMTGGAATGSRTDYIKAVTDALVSVYATQKAA